MRNAVKYIVLLACVAVVFIVTAAALGVSGAKNNARTCSGVDIVILDSLESRFVSGKDIRRYLIEGYGDCTGDSLSKIDLKKIEETIDSKSAVSKSEAYIRGDRLNIEVTQRKPMIRFQGKDGGFYSDSEGYLFPLKDNYTSYVVVVDGKIPLKVSAGYKGRGNDEKEEKWIADMTSLVRYMEKSGVWADNIVQIHVEDNGDLTLIPREGKERFLFGKPDRIEEKFELMSYYYRSIVPAKGKDFYSSVNLKFDKQIICKK